ncbi:hypothetical protein [Campylobacter concisus]|jgi:hypothetical protein|uniref:hypothetical protein n=1 Tax=Campylobacter concisus TaxID=199 RepID=UPI000CD8487A|nr:hypothetical protein [Campylobacter concisus]
MSKMDITLNKLADKISYMRGRLMDARKSLRKLESEYGEFVYKYNQLKNKRENGVKKEDV